MTKLIWRNLLRNKRRSFLTMASVALALLILSLLGAVLNAMDTATQSDAGNQMVVRNAISLTFPLPEAYGQRIVGVPHVVAVTPLNWFQGVYKDNRPENFFPRFATDADTLLKVFPEYQIPDDQYQAFSSDRSGFIAGKRLVEKYGWKIGDRITIKGDIYPIDAEITLRGIFEAPDNPSAERQLYFHRRYVEEATGNPGTVATYWLRVDDPASAAGVAKEIEAMFENSQARVRAETAEAFALSFMEMMGNVRFLFGAIGLAIVISIFLITANTMAMAARERTTEVAVLRTLGFGKGQVIGVVVGEALVIGVLGSALGALLALGLLNAVAPAIEDMGFLFGGIEVTPRNLAIAIGIGVSIGLLSGVFPAFAAARLRIADGLRRV